MLIDTVELTMSHTGLGNLTEYALLVLFGNAHSHRLTMGTGITPDQMIDNEGLVLYPAYYRTHLKVPPGCLLSTFKLWERVQVGVDVKRFGETLLESTYSFGREGDIPQAEAGWNTEQLPSMTGSNLILVDVTQEDGDTRRFSPPKAGFIAEIPKLLRPPLAIQQANTVKSEGFVIEDFNGTLTSPVPILYKVVPYRDAAPGHAMIFAKFSEIMDYAEFVLLSEILQPAIPPEILYHISVVEREVYYYANCFAGETLEISIEGDIEDYRSLREEVPGNPMAGFTFVVDIVQQRGQVLLAKARVKKILNIPEHVKLADEAGVLISSFCAEYKKGVSQ